MSQCHSTFDQRIEQGANIDTGGHLLVQTGRNLEGRRQEGRDVDPDERTARVKGNERPLPPPLLLHPAWHLTDVV